MNLLLYLKYVLFYFFCTHLFFVHVITKHNLNKEKGYIIKNDYKYKRKRKHNNLKKKAFFILCNNCRTNNNKFYIIFNKKRGENICNVKKTKGFVYLRLNNKDHVEKNNVVNNNKEIEKLLLDVLGDRPNWYDSKYFSPAKINLFLRLKEKKETYNEVSTLMHSLNLGDDIFIRVLKKEDQNRLRHFLHPCESGDFLTTVRIEDENIGKETLKEDYKIDDFNRNDKGLFKNMKEDVMIEAHENLAYEYNHYPLNDDNIIIKVLKRYREEFNISDEIRFLIHVNKRIPIFSGVGGGSSNGATVFYFLENNFYKYFKGDPLKENDFLKTIGSDISFFSSSGFAYCSGKGNNVTDLKNIEANIKDKDIYLFKIDDGLSSKLVYKNVDYKKIVQYNPVNLLKCLINTPENDDIIKQIEEKEKNFVNTFIPLDNRDNLQNIFVNDLEHSAFYIIKKLQHLKEYLRNQNMFDVVSMSGSGSSLFALSNKKKSQTHEISSSFQKEGIKKLINDIKIKFNMNVRVYLCDALRKAHNAWYDPTKLAHEFK
ncbi:4-diphosphocytidyl-2-C-methyl-D-erythritol kinase, putative [Plasmodium gaboni]|uniref:4-diphosphocytidyl-2-C-methyl-D-erythritol kinase, putative n=1 Tax=Plasmodium gaboni TaxID=647221 RepID=A0ABY1UIT5_9APIC|nr:4-diphosphocytidyl-2-C-methyl-D-erythritol kinase, putative [Plasmodium gaboni]